MRIYSQTKLRKFACTFSVVMVFCISIGCHSQYHHHDSYSSMHSTHGMHFDSSHHNTHIFSHSNDISLAILGILYVLPPLLEAIGEAIADALDGL